MEERHGELSVDCPRFIEASYLSTPYLCIVPPRQDVGEPLQWCSCESYDPSLGQCTTSVQETFDVCKPSADHLVFTKPVTIQAFHLQFRQSHARGFAVSARAPNSQPRSLLELLTEVARLAVPLELFFHSSLVHDASSGHIPLVYLARRSVPCRSHAAHHFRHRRGRRQSRPARARCATYRSSFSPPPRLHQRAHDAASTRDAP